MNILFINSIGVDTWGGGEKWMLLTAGGLREKGHHIHVVCRPGSRMFQRFSKAAHVLYPLHISGDFGPVNIVRLAHYFYRNRIDIVIANFNKDIRLAGLAGKLSTRPAVIARAGLAILQNKTVYKHTYTRLVDGVITNTRAIREQYQGYGWLPPDFVRVIYNGIDIQPLPPIDSEAVRRQYGFPEGSPVLGIFGRLVGQKQHNRFLEVAAKLYSDYPEAIYLIVGEGPLQDRLQQQAQALGIADRVCFTGFQKDPTPLYLFCDVVLLTSAFEGLPNVVLEAMHLARPVIAFDVGGVRELIRDENTGWVVPKDDTSAMGDALRSLLKHKERRTSMGAAARKFVETEFSLEKMIANVEIYLAEIQNKER